MTETRRAWHDQRLEERGQYPEMFAAHEAFLRAVEVREPGIEDRPMIEVVGPSEIPRFLPSAPLVIPVANALAKRPLPLS